MDITDPVLALFKLHFPNATKNDYFRVNAHEKTITRLNLDQIKKDEYITLETIEIKKPKVPSCSLEVLAVSVIGAGVIGLALGTLAGSTLK